MHCPSATARRAIDGVNNVVREPATAATAEQRRAAQQLAAAAGDVIGYHDDASLRGAIEALCTAYAVYASEAAKKNWQCVVYKSMLTGVWFDERREGERDDQNSPVLDAKPRSWKVGLLPGVTVTYAADGVISLAVPIGRPQYVQWQLERQLREQAECMRLIVEYAADESKATHHQGHCLARGIALQL